MRALFRLSASVVVATAVVSAAPRPARAPSGETRGLWVLRASLTSEDRIRTMVRTAEAAGFNTLMIQVRGRGEALYRSAVEPRASDLDGQPADFDPLAVTLDAAHRAGLRVHAWINVNLIASGTTLPRSPQHIVSRHPEWLMVPRDLAPTALRTDVHSPAYLGQLMRWTRAASDKVEGLYLSPLTAGAQDYTVSVVHDLVARYPLDGLHLDYARYPNDTFDYSASALAAFRANRLSATSVADRQRLDQRVADDPLIWTRMFPEGWIAFRRDRLTALVSRVALDARAVRPGLVVSAAVAPSALEARVTRLQDWPLWASTGTIDVVCPMAYATDLSGFATEVADARASAGATPVWAGIAAYLLPVADASAHVRAARQAGVSGVLVFSYDSLTVAESAGYLAGLRATLLESPRGTGPGGPAPGHE
jgi:uncharacterized lipoprotein YddW (UPF0748 family)